MTERRNNLPSLIPGGEIVGLESLESSKKADTFV